MFPTVSVDDLFNNEYREKSVTFEQDPLVLACVVKRLLEINPGTYLSLDSQFVTGDVTDSDVALAEDIRKYYTKKWFWQSLKDGRGLSDFRRQVCYLLENRIKECKDRDTGIYYKLPWFYDEDMIYDTFKQQYNTTELPTVAYGMKPAKTKFELTYLKSTVSRQQKRKLERFWFTNGTYLYTIMITQDNPLLEMFRNMIEQGKTVQIESYYKVDRLDQMYFYSLFQFNFLKEHNA
jgi:hypothetical protein